MSLLYIVSESGNDAVFYALCAERITGREFTPVPMENRKGDGEAAVRMQLKYALRQARAAAGGAESVCFIAALDNDRSPHEETHGLDRTRLIAQERNRANRKLWMQEMITTVLGQNPAEWPMPVALAVPVEMLESWIVRARRDAESQPTPYFSEADSELARLYYAPEAPPPQWKDLAAELQSECGHADKRAFYTQVVQELDAEALASRSESFRLFKAWLDGWPKAGPAA